MQYLASSSAISGRISVIASLCLSSLYLLELCLLFSNKAFTRLVSFCLFSGHFAEHLILSHWVCGVAVNLFFLWLLYAVVTDHVMTLWFMTEDNLCRLYCTFSWFLSFSVLYSFECYNRPYIDTSCASVFFYICLSHICYSYRPTSYVNGCRKHCGHG